MNPDEYWPNGRPRTDPDSHMQATVIATRMMYGSNPPALSDVASRITLTKRVKDTQGCDLRIAMLAARMIIAHLCQECATENSQKIIEITGFFPPDLS